MSARTLGVAVIVLLAGTVFVARGWWDGPERRIHRVLDEIAERLSHDSPMSGLGAASAAAGLQEFFTPDVTIEMGPSGASVSGRDAVVASAARVLATVPALDVEFVDRQIALQASPDAAPAARNDRAEVTCNVTSVARDRAGQPTRDAREINLTMQFVDGRWVIARVKAVNVLEPVQ